MSASAALDQRRCHLRCRPSYMASTSGPVALGDDAAAQLAGTRQHAVIGAEFAVQDARKRWICDFASAGLLRQVGVDAGDAVGDQPVHLVLRGKIGVAGVGDALLVGPSADGGHVDVDERADHVAPIAESHRFLDVGNELEPVFEQLGRIGRAVVQGADILDAVDDPQMPVIAEIAGVAGVEPAFGIPGLRRGFADRGDTP